MKKYIVSTIAVLIVFALTLAVFAQAPEAAGAGRGAGQGAGARAGRGAGARAGRGGGATTQQQQDAVAAIEKQFETLKANVEALAEMPVVARGGAAAGGQEMSETEIQNVRQQRTARQQLIQTAAAAIEQQIKIFRANQLQTEHQAAQAELQAIADSANEENATATAKLVQDLIASREQAFQDTITSLGITLGRGRGQGRGQARGQAGARQGRGQGAGQQ